MSETLQKVKALVAIGIVRISDHGYDELAADDILVEDVLASVGKAVIVEDYPHAIRGPSVLVLQRDPTDRAIHVVWGIPQGRDAPAVLITAYRPDPKRWSTDFRSRSKQ